ncbi:MAG: AraC family transcriptional regulator [Caulobacteraceae bacterium]|nr:AraC family transcriptional regulator [Caulobacteraceae bacterium]
MLPNSERTPGFWADNVMPLAQWTKFVSTDIDAVREHMSRMFCPHQLNIEGGAPPVAFRHNHTALGAMTFNATDYGTPYGRVSVVIPPIEELILVQFTLSGRAQITQCGMTFDLVPGQMCVLSGDTPVRQVLDKDYKHFTVKISRAETEAILAKELGYKPERLVFSPAPAPLTGAAAAFSHLIRTICDDIDSGLSAYAHPRTAGAIQDTLKRLLLAAAPHNYSDLFNATPTGAAPYYVRRVEEYIRAHAREPISLADMIEVSGVSARSLHAGFRRFRGLTPMGYLKNYRLDLAHAKLKSGAANGSSVTEIAMASGFSHLSKFAHDYAERFGERPSATLKQLGH